LGTSSLFLAIRHNNLPLIDRHFHFKKMLFNSFEYLLFLPIVFICYWQLEKISPKVQLIFLVLTSYIFYGWWDWRFLGLIIVSTMTDFVIALK